MEENKKTKVNINEPRLYVPYIVFESALAREERMIKRMYVIIITLIISLLLTIGIFMWYTSLPTEEYTDQEITDTELDKSTITQKVGD